VSWRLGVKVVFLVPPCPLCKKRPLRAFVVQSVPRCLTPELSLARRFDPVLSSGSMNVPLTAEIHREGEWFVAFCPEVPEANGQGSTQEECLASLREAVLLLMEDRRADACQRLEKETSVMELV